MSDSSDVEVEIATGRFSTRSPTFNRTRSPPSYKFTKLTNVTNLDERHGLLSDVSDDEGKPVHPLHPKIMGFHNF